MAESNRRPSIVSKHTHIRAQEHFATITNNLLASPRVLDSLLVSVGYAGPPRTSTHDSIKTLRGNLPLFRLAPWAWIRSYQPWNIDRDHARSKFCSMVRRWKDKGGENLQERNTRSWTPLRRLLGWRRRKKTRTREVQEEEHLRCWKAYTAKEEAYVAYEKHGGYGGADWMRYVWSASEARWCWHLCRYSKADCECRVTYKYYERQQGRLHLIHLEIREILMIRGEAGFILNRKLIENNRILI